MIHFECNRDNRKRKYVLVNTRVYVPLLVDQSFVSDVELSLKYYNTKYRPYEFSFGSNTLILLFLKIQKSAVSTVEGASPCLSMMVGIS